MLFVKGKVSISIGNLFQAQAPSRSDDFKKLSVDLRADLHGTTL